MAKTQHSGDTAGSSLFNTITKAARTVDSVVTKVDNSLDLLVTSTGELKKRAFATSQILGDVSRETYVNKKRLEIARNKHKSEKELDADPKLRELFDAIKARQAKVTNSKDNET